MYKQLFCEGKIGTLQLKNRIVMAPMATLADSDGGFSQSQIDYYEERAKGGAGLIVTGSLSFTSKLGAPYTGVFESIKHVGKAQKLADAVHRYGAKLAFEFNMGGGRCGGNVSASEIPTLANPSVLCHALTTDEIHAIVDDMGKSALLAKSAEVDAIMIHAYAGYLLDQFQSSEWNHRIDEYGGSIENRMRLTCELIQAIKKTCGQRFPVLIKFSVDHGTETGRHLPEGIEMCKILEKAGANAILVDTGSFATQWNRCIPTVYEPDAYSLEATKAVKQALSIPVLGQNKLSRPELAEKALEDGVCDFIALGHAFLADPAWSNKVQNGSEDQIRVCIGCNNCLLSTNTGKAFRCTVNPFLMHEKDSSYIVKKAETPKKVLVLGGGPAGMSAAITAARMGHSVELWEREAFLGGNALAASVPLNKKDVGRYVEYLVGQMKTLGVAVSTGKTTTAKEVADGKYDMVILATGSHSKILPVEGAELPIVVPVLDYLHKRRSAGKNVVVLGGGLVGCETACSVAEKADHVTILEFMPKILMTAAEARNNDISLHQHISAAKIEIICGAAATKIEPDGITYKKDGESHKLPCDTIIMATGFVSDNHLLPELRKAGVPVIPVGDSVMPRKIMTAVREGMFAVLDQH